MASLVLIHSLSAATVSESLPLSMALAYWRNPAVMTSLKISRNSTRSEKTSERSWASPSGRANDAKLKLSASNVPVQIWFRRVVISANNAHDEGIHVYIGTENDSDVMKDTTLIFKNISLGSSQFAVGVIGPKRMNYSKVIDMLNKLTGGLDRIFTEDALPSGYDERD